MSTVTLAKVLIWYWDSHRGIEARVRTYADSLAIKEESTVIPDDDLMALAAKDKRNTWDERDVCAALGDGVVWCKSEKGRVLIADIASA